MRHGVTRKVEEDEGESAFISMTDMTVSVLFIVMILLAFFASQYSREDRVPRSELVRAEQERDAATARAAVIQSELDRALDRIRELEALLETLRARVSALTDEIAALAARLAERTAERDAAITEAETLRAALDDARQQIAVLDDERSRLEAEVARLRDQLRDRLEEYLSGVDRGRSDLLERLRERIEAALVEDFPDLEVVVSNERDALRFQGGGLFASNGTAILPARAPFIRAVAEALDAALPCYTLGPRASFSETCNPNFALIEAVQIEGHTDADGDDAYNLSLSAQRSVATHEEMLRFAPGLTAHKNLDGEPVLSVAGYGEGRPIDPGLDPVGKARNRRIDLRFIMLSPRRGDEIDGIRAALRRVSETEQP